MNALDALLSSKSNEWHTESEYVDAARDVMGGIDLDPASCEIANQTIQAARYFSAADDGLSKPWTGRVWLNPPYGKTGGKSNQARWSARLRRDYCAGHVSQAVLLVNACTGDRWFSPLWDYAICFPDHRIKFISPMGRRNQPTHSSCFVYFGPNVDAFAWTFGAIGPVVRGGRVIAERRDTAPQMMQQGALL